MPDGTIHLEAEEGTLTGVTVATARASFSGTGYVTGFANPGDNVAFSFRAPPGIRDLRIRYSAPFGDKGYDLVVNGTRLSGLFRGTGNAFATHAAGKVELKAGVNTIVIEKGWGYFDIDYIELTPVAMVGVRQPPGRLADPKAAGATHALFGYLVERYGRQTLSGQYDLSEAEYIHATTGRWPAILGGDFMDYSPSRRAYGADPTGTTEQMIRAAREGHIVTMSWHWNAPKDLLDKTYKNERGESVDAHWYKGFYTNATTFDVARALSRPDSEEYRLLLRDMDAIATELKKFAAANVPILWRPLHEAEGAWFWWGAKGPAPFKTLWHLMFDRFTKMHGLHNLIWVFTSGTKPEWYPGDAYVDVIGVDAYPSDPNDPLSSTWEALLKSFDGRMLLALTEFGGVPDIERMKRFGVRWSYFVSWTGDLGPKKTPKDILTRVYLSPDVINRDSLKRLSR
jgi:mannan endo-1,4-beta-mannosidase